MTSRTPYRLLLAGAILIVLLNSWLALHSVRTLVEAQRWQAHTLEVLSQTERTVADVRTAESAARGYILTGAPTFEEQYAHALQSVHANVAQAATLTQDNPEQQKRLSILRTRLAAKFGALEAGMEVRRAQPQGLIDPSLLSAVTSDTPDRAESVAMAVRDIEAEEQRLLDRRTSDTATAKRQVWFTFALALVLDLVLLVVAFELLGRAAQDREKLAQRAEEITELNGELQGLNRELEERVASRTRELEVSNQELEAFSYSVSHDLRAPLRTIDGFSLALLEDFSDKLNDEGRDYIGRVRNGVQRMGTLIDALLQLSRVTRAEVSTEPVDLSQTATLVFNELKAADPARQVEWVAAPGVMAHGDGRLLRIALENLIGNAWKFTSKTAGARIEFGSDQREGRTVYFVRDNGAGFDMQYVDRLFTAFQRLHGDRDFKGSGIGLATVSRIVRRHYGTIWAESVQGEGATFFFSLGEIVPGQVKPAVVGSEEV